MSADRTEPSTILQSLGLTDEQAQHVLNGTARVVVVAMTAHMDWDWLLPFPVLVSGAPGAGGGASVYFGSSSGPATAILGQAAQALADDPHYRYSVCEMGFLRGFAEADPDAFKTFAAHADRVHLCGAGITSPDSLLPHVEAFIRNYLVGRLWAADALPSATISQSYVPDDFGHDVELPGTLRAMGIEATAFARLPGAWGNPMDPKTAPDGEPTQAAALFTGKQIDFRWEGADGSAVLAHWMPDWYSGNVPTGQLKTRGDVQAMLSADVGDPSLNLHGTVLDVSPGNYAYMGLGNDFGLPMTGLPEAFSAWNAAPGDPPVFVGMGTFDDFVQLASAGTGPAPLATGQPRTTPYMAGCHATRPAIKILHQRAVRALLAAEALTAALAGRAAPTSTAAAVTGEAPGEALLEAWNLLAPSTHHDYITGTAQPHVYRNEQLPLLREAVARAEWLRDDAAAGFAALIPPPEGAGTGAAVAVFNPSAYAGPVLAECPPAAIGEGSAVTGAVAGPFVQPSAEGRSLFLADVPALGYGVAVGSGGGQPPAPADPVTVTASAEEVVLTSGTLTVTLSAASGWGISSLLDGGASVFHAGSTANGLVVYTEDTGTEYVYAPEGGGQLSVVAGGAAATGMEVLEDGPLRARVRTTCTYPSPDGGAPLTFVREYALISGEPFLRMSLTGAAPAPPAGSGATDVAVTFPFPTAPDALLRGTPGHWTGQMPQLLWPQLTTYASHHFTIASAGGQFLGGLLHADVHAWGLWSESGKTGDVEPAIYGILLRNTDGDFFRWPPANYAGQPPYPGGTDADTHTRLYAFLPPSACSDPATGEPLAQARRFATSPLVTPLSVFATNATEAPSSSLSFAATTQGPATVTVLKGGSRAPRTVVLRLYHPAPGPSATATVAFDPYCIPGWTQGSGIVATPLTALEEPAGAPAGVTGTQLTVPMPRAIATIGLSVA